MLQIETVLQFLGSAAIIQLVASKLVYAEVLISFFSQWPLEIWPTTFSFIVKMIFVVKLFSTYLCRSQDRKKTLQQIDDFFNKKIAPKELVDEIKVVRHPPGCLELNLVGALFARTYAWFALVQILISS